MTPSRQMIVMKTKSHLLTGRDQGVLQIIARHQTTILAAGNFHNKMYPMSVLDGSITREKVTPGNDYGSRTARTTQSSHQEQALSLELELLHWQLAPCISLLWRRKGEGNGRRYTKAQDRQRQYQANHTILCCNQRLHLSRASN